MTSVGKAIGFGLLVWLVPFVIAFLSFPVRQSMRPLFESIMAVAVTSTAVVFGILYMRRSRRSFALEGLVLGLIWLVISIVIDSPLMLLGGPMKMSFAAYMADIGLTYLIFPIVTWGLGSVMSGVGPRA